MRTLTLSILAASALLIPATASAEQAGGGHRGGGAMHGGGNMQGGGHRGGGAMHGGGNMQGGGHWRGGGMVGRPGHGPNVVVRHGGGRFMHPGPNFRHHRLQRGFFIHPFWFGPQFHVNNWQVYGFADPGPDRRWVRYYDDAYMIDRGGRVIDMREDFDWDSYGEQWEVEDGIPAYRGSRDYVPDEEDYAWFERHDGEERHGDRHGGDGHRGGHHEDGWDEGQSGHGGSGYGYGGYGYGYGYGVAYPIVIETTVTTGGYSEEEVEEYVEVQQARRRVRHVRPRCACPRPAAHRPAPRPAPRRAPPRRPPPPGERG